MLKQNLFRSGLTRAFLLAVLLGGGVGLSSCGSNNAIYVSDLIAKAQEYNGKDVVVNGSYIGRPGNPPMAVLALGVSTLDNGLDAQPLGDQIWLEGFPEPVVENFLHQPGDAVYGFVRVTGRFEAGGAYGPQNAYKYRIHVSSVEPIERVQRKEVRVPDEPVGAGSVALRTLFSDPARYNGQVITTRGYYFWNGAIYVLAEGISMEEDGSSPQPIGQQIWMEGFPPDESGKLHVGQGFVWGYVEVTGPFKSGSGFGRDGAYTAFLQVQSAKALAQK